MLDALLNGHLAYDKKEALGLFVKNKSAAFSMSVLTNVSAHQEKAILFTATDNLTSFTDCIRMCLPNQKLKFASSFKSAVSGENSPSSKF